MVTNCSVFPEGILKKNLLESDEATENGAGRQEMEEHVDGVLLQKFVQSVTPYSLWSSFSAAQTATRK